MSKTRNDIIKRLYDKGIIKDKNILNHYLLTLNDFMNTQKNENVNLFKKEPLIDLNHSPINDTTVLYNKIIFTIENEKLYLIPSLDLNYLSKKFNLSSTYISKKINQSQNSSFKDYINRLRLKEAKTMLRGEKYKNYTILAIAFECGFNSRSAFYSAFKKQYNITPTAYRKF